MGLNNEKMVAAGAVWILNRMRVKILRMPVYRDTLLKRSPLPTGSVTQVGIQYLKEIGREIHGLQAGLAMREDGAHFRFHDPSAVYAAGFVTFDAP